MTNDNRVPAGVPTGGEFATGQRAENPDLDHVAGRLTPETHEEKVERHVAIWKVIGDQYLAELEDERATTFTTGMANLGNLPNGYRVGARLNVVLDMTDDPDMGDWIASIDAVVTPPNISGGQLLATPTSNAAVLHQEDGDFGELVQLARGFSAHNQSNHKLDPGELKQAIALMDRMSKEAQR